MTAVLPPKLPLWATDPGVILEPSEAAKQAGYVVNFRPPARIDNYWQNNVYRHIEVLLNSAAQTVIERAGPLLDGGVSTTTSIYAQWYAQQHHFLVTTDGGTYRSYRSADGNDWQDAGLEGQLPTLYGSPQLLGIIGTDTVMVAAGDGAQAKRSTNGGVTWSNVTAAANTNVMQNFYLAEAGIIARHSGGGSGTLASSDDGDVWGIPSYTVDADALQPVANGPSNSVLVNSTANHEVIAANILASTPVAHGVTDHLPMIMFSETLDRYIMLSSTGALGSQQIGFWVSNDNAASGAFVRVGNFLDIGALGTNFQVNSSDPLFMYQSGGRIAVVCNRSIYSVSADFLDFRKISTMAAEAASIALSSGVGSTGVRSANVSQPPGFLLHRHYVRITTNEPVGKFFAGLALGDAPQAPFTV